MKHYLEKTQLNIVIFWGILPSLLLAGILISLALHFGVGGNLGLEIGYYGKFNRIMRVINETHEYEVKDARLHEDISLEDFYLVVEDRMLRREKVFFSESDLRESNSSESLKLLAMEGLRRAFNDH